MRKSPGKVRSAHELIAEQAAYRLPILTIKEIAHLAGLDRSTVQVHLSRELSRLKRERERQKVVSHGTSEHSHSTV